MPVILNKIDSVIINNVHKQTAEEVVNTYDKTRVSKEKKDNRGGSYSGKRMKEKLDKFNSILGLMDVDANFVMDEDSLVALDKDGNEIKRYTKEALIEILNKMEDLIGVFVDIKR